MSLHAKFSPSGASKWMNCFGALALEVGQPDDSSVYADEGTAAHDVAAQCLRDSKNAEDFIGQTIDVLNNDGTVRGSYEVDTDFASAVQAYVNYVRDTAGKDGLVLTEQRLDISEVLATPDQFGTGDAIVVNFETRNLLFADLKFGRGEQVYASYREEIDGPMFPNHQLALYALGALKMLEITGIEVDSVTLAVVQPRLDWIDEYTVSVEDLRAFEAKARQAVAVQRTLTREVVLAFEPDQPLGYRWLKPTEKGCRWCKAKGECPALTAKVSEVLTHDFTAIDAGHAPAMVPAAQAIATDEQISRRAQVIDMVEGWVKAVGEETNRRVFAGATIVGIDGQPMKIVEGKQGDRKWADEAKALAALNGVLSPAELYTAPVLKGIPQIEAAMGKVPFRKRFIGKAATDTKPAEEPMFPDLISRTPGRPTVALGSDKRNPISAPPAEATDFPAIDPLCA